jgi:hypothetical protein
MKTEPDYYDPKIAGWWVWGQCMWIGGGWCSQKMTQAGTPTRRPVLGSSGRSDLAIKLSNQIPHLGDAGKGVNRGDLTSGTQRESLSAYMRELAGRLRTVRVCCGDWSRVCGPTPTVKLGTTGVFLDPPYSEDAGRDKEIYATDDLTVAHDVRKWAIENGNHPDLRIALCGYDGEHDMPDSWECIEWKAAGGYGSQGDGAGRENSARERIWFSPHCLKPQEQLPFRETLVV